MLMKKLFTLIAATLMAVCASAQITFDEKDAYDGNVFTKTDGTLTITINSTSSSKAIEANSQYFGTKAADAVQLNYRAKTGGKSKSTDYVTINTKKAGTIYLYVRSSSSSSTRTVTLSGVTSTTSLTIGDGNIASETISDSKIFTPYEIVATDAGDITFEYDGALNFYGVSIDAAIVTAINEVSATSESTKAVKCVENGQLVIKKGNNRYNAAGALLK